MNESLQSNYLFLKYFFTFIVIETIFLLISINKEFLLFKILINYLFVIAVIPFIFEKIKKGRIDPFSSLAIFSFFYLLLFGIRAVDMLIFNQKAIIDDEKFYTQALIYAIIGLHFFQIGYFLNLSRFLVSKKKFLSDKWSPNKFKIILIGYSLLSILSFLIIIELSGGFSFYFSNIHNAMVSITAGTTIFFISVLLIKIPLLIWLCLILEKNKKLSISFVLFSIVVLLLLASLGERGHLISLLISTLVCYHYLKKPLKLMPIISVAIILISFLVMFGQYRDFTSQSHQMKKAGFNIRIGTAAIYHYFMAHFDQIRHVKDVIKLVPDDFDFQYGKTFMSLLVKPIPSLIWEGKPQGAGRIVTKNIYPQAYALNVTVAPSLLGELFLNFHVIGVICGMFLFGIFCRIFYIFLNKNYRNKNVVIIYAICLPYIFNELRGDFNIVTSFLIFILFFVLLAVNYITIKE